MTALGANIFRIGRSREVTEPNTEYIFSQRRRVKIEFSFFIAIHVSFL